MQPIINKIAVRCVEAGIVEEDELDWFVYGLEKRVTTVITASFFLAVGTLAAGFWTTLSYLGSFYFLRVRANGYHAKSFLGCLTSSLLLELAFLLALRPLFNVYVFCALNLWSLVLVFALVPFNHPHMHLNRREEHACRVSARIRISVLTVLAIVFWFVGIKCVAEGIALGNTMTALLLVIAKIKKGAKKHEKGTETEQKAA